MPAKDHRYAVSIAWTGNRGPGTTAYGAYGRDHLIAAGAKPEIAGSADPAFRGDPARWNPEDLLVAAVAACHQLWYLHLCAVNGIAVLAYRDDASGTLVENDATGGRFTGVVLRPQVTLRAGDDAALAMHLHGEAHARCFVANSLAVPVTHRPTVTHAR